MCCNRSKVEENEAYGMGSTGVLPKAMNLKLDDDDNDEKMAIETERTIKSWHKDF